MEERRVLITGASRGIGRAIAQALVEEGYRVIGTSRNPERIEPENHLSGVEYLPLELADEESIERLIEAVGQVDVLINNGGLSQVGAVEEVPMERIRHLFELNLMGAIRLIQGFLPSMREKGRGFIINIGSMAGRIAVPFSSIYAAAKAGLESLSRGLRTELAEFGIKVVLIAPQYIRTGLEQDVKIEPDSPYYRKLVLIKHLRDRRMARGLEPEAVAETVLRILHTREPRAFYPVGRRAPLFAFLSKVLPEGLFERALRKSLGLS